MTDLLQAKKHIQDARQSLKDATALISNDPVAGETRRMGGAWGTIEVHLDTCIHYTESIESWIARLEGA